MPIFRFFLVGVGIFFSVGSSIASVLYEQFTALESTAEFAEKTLYTFIQDRDLLSGAERLCSSETLAKWNRFWEKLAELLDTRYIKMSDAQMLVDSLDLWNRVHAMHGRLAKSISDDELCIRKVLMYTLQRHLRKWHIELIDQRWLIDDFNLQNPTLREVTLKKDILDVLIQQANLNTKIQLPKISVTVANPYFLDTLSVEQRVLAERSRLVMEAAIYEVLSLFLKKWRFTQQDINTIKDVVVLEYTANCGSVAGKYEVTYEVDSKWQRKNTQTNALHLTVSTCTKVGFVLQSFWLSKLIVIHELGHHMRWYKDKNPEKFALLCRDKNDKRTDRCTNRDFVTEYAQIAPEEDYAEHFQQWVIRRRSRPWFIDTKLRYFDALFK